MALPTCIVNPGENVLLPDPGYTDYLGGVMLANANPVPLNLEPPHYLPDWSKVDAQTLARTSLVYLTYPNNPTGSTATKAVFDEEFKDLKVRIQRSFMISRIVLLDLMQRTQVYLFLKMQRK